MADEMHIPDMFDSRLKRHIPKKDWFSRQALIASLQLAFKQNPVILLYGENGAGKTTSAAAFALGEVTTGALEGNPVIYSSFQEIDNLTDLLESFGQVYEMALLERSIEWRTLDDYQRLKLIQDLLHNVPLLWIWDDFELVTPKKWSADEIQQLEELLRSIPSGGGRILILDRRQEKELLTWLPEQIQIDLGIPNPLGQEIASVLEPTQSPGSTKSSGTSAPARDSPSCAVDFF